MCAAEILTLWKVDQNYPDNFEMWCWRKFEKNIQTDRVRNEVLHRVQQERDILYAINSSQDNLIGHSSLRNCFLIHTIERKGGSDEKTGKEA